MNNIPEGLRLARANAIVPAIQQQPPAGPNAPAFIIPHNPIVGPVGGPLGDLIQQQPRGPSGASPRRGRKNNRKSRRNNTRKNRKYSRKNRRN